MNLLKWICTWLCLVFLMLTSLAGCGKTESENVRSGGVAARIKVLTEGNGSTDVEVRLKSGDSYPLFQDDLKLSSGDRLRVYANGMSQLMSEINNFFEVSYITTFPFDDAGIEYQVAFERDDEVSALNSTVTMPAAFNITTASDLVYADTDIVTTNWTPANSPDRILIGYHLECMDASFNRHYGLFAATPADSGQQDTAVSDILTNALGTSNTLDYSNGCDLEVVVKRVRTGILDANYGGGGHINAVQQRSIDASIAAP